MLSALAPFVSIAGAIAAPPGRTVTVVASDDVGAPLERAFESALYARAAAADAEMRWDDARLLYRQAGDAWTAIARTRPSRALENAIAKAEHEALASQALVTRARSGVSLPFGNLPEEARRAFQRRQALEDAHLLRGKLMATRAALGRLPPELYARTRARLETARDAAAKTREGRRRGRAATVRHLRRRRGRDRCAPRPRAGHRRRARRSRQHAFARRLRRRARRERRRPRHAGELHPPPHPPAPRQRPARGLPVERLGPPARRPSFREPFP